MTERPEEPDQGAMPEDMASLYSQADKQGTRYWDFSASRREVQGQFRLRIAREHAQRAGAQPLPPLPTREFSEPFAEPFGQAGVSQFQPSPFQAGNGQPVDFETPLVREPAFASGAGTPEIRKLAEVRDLTNPSPRDTLPVAVPRREVSDLKQQPSTRWYALHSVLEPARVVVEPPLARPISFEQRPPMMAVFSMAGGVGKTCLVATLGRALSALGEQVLLAETAGGGLLPFYFGSRDSKPGVVRTFAPPASSFPSIRAENDAPVQVLSLQAEERFPQFDSGHDPLLGELVHDGRAASRILIDVGTASREIAGRLLLLRPAVLVPILPDINSVASLGSIERWLANEAIRPGREGREARTFYLLNQFDDASALHQDVREMLQERLGERLLPFVLRRSSAVSEGLAEGMTVIDYAPDSEASEDYRQLAGWLRRVAAPAAVGEGSSRWSER